MIPAAIIQLKALPRLSNGKLNRHALPKWDCANELKTHAVVPPQTATEKLLAQLWQELLGVTPISLTDSFFSLGGDSILAIRLVSRARAAGLTFAPKDVFLYPTLAGLAKVAQPVHDAGEVVCR
ncbi:phosphopantetheine-binding protein [Methylocucumis oryzae]|uniref:phosphopantetheine-binding protein n=1 Tax=Methylocucumis oryzae TaxID=1632867 RepID=UPI0006970E7F|nr:phosphopantetheine-binding protein [Methylocucumis oryzae]